MEAKFSPRVKDVITYSREEALRLGHDYIGTEHLLLGIIRDGEGMAIKILQALGVNLTELRRFIEQSIKTPAKPTNNLQNIPLIKQAEKALKITYLEAKVFKSAMIGTEHLLLSILKVEDNLAASILAKFNVDYEAVKAELELLLTNPDASMGEAPRADLPGSASEDDDADDAGSFAQGAKKPVDPKSKTPVLDNFGRDLTKAAEEDKLDPIVGREKEIERVSQILSRRKKNNPILIGEPGVGKSAIAEGLALRIVQKKYHEHSSENELLL